MVFHIVLLLHAFSLLACQDVFVHIDKDNNLSISPQRHISTVAEAHLKNQIAENGWAFLKVTTDHKADDVTQAYAAGFAEGHVTKDLIRMHWNNTVASYCFQADKYCSRLFNYLKLNLEWIQEQVQLHRNDPFWKQMNLVLWQLSGLQDAYHGQLPVLKSKEHPTINVRSLLMLQIAGDLDDLEQALKKPKHLRKHSFGSGSCSAFIKATTSDLLVSHVTWNTYNAMLRIQKLYDLRFKSINFPGSKISMSSYPGVLASIDDFLLSSAGLAVTETTISNSNRSLLALIQPTGTVLTWMRGLISTRLASDGAQWIHTFSRYNSGTYNNQWMIIDYNVCRKNRHPSSKLFYVLEQMPGTIQAEDMTSFLSEQGYWASYNVPYFPGIFNISGSWENVKKHGDFFTHDKCPRALMFKRMWTSVNDIPSLIKLMRYNDFKHDPLAKCNCSPPYSGENGISARCDLNPKNGTYPFETLGFRCHGATDMKVTSTKMIDKLAFTAISGPTHDPLPPFAWSTSECAKEQKHEGQPDKFVFEPVTHYWD